MLNEINMFLKKEINNRRTGPIRELGLGQGFLPKF